MAKAHNLDPAAVSITPGLKSGSVTQSLDRALALLDGVASYGVAGVTLTDLVRDSGLSKPTAHRLLNALRHAGMVDYDTRQRRYFVAFKIYRMGQQVASRFEVVHLAQATLDALAEETGDTVYLVVRNGDFHTCEARSIGAYPIKTLTLDIGDWRPLGVGSNGIALMMRLPDAEVTRLMARHADALAAYPEFCGERLLANLSRARQQGYALNEGFMLPEMSAIAMPVQSPAGTVEASISVAAITSRMQEPRRGAIAGAMAREIATLEARFEHHWARWRSA